MEVAVYDKHVDKEDEYYSEFARYPSYDEVFREQAFAEDNSIGYTDEELRELADTLPFRYLVVDFELLHGKQQENSLSLGILIVRLDVGLSEDEIWGDAFEYETFLEDFQPGTPDPISERRLLRERSEE
ncbi:hypothetical protein DJ74_16635 [Halorubrum sp. Ea8]|nr:hypothetical protein DJ74_16635 [Halorubrum sp. Ea8]